MIEEETRGKLAAQAKARQEQDEKEMLKERLEEEEENKATFEKQIQDLQAKVKTLFTTGKSPTFSLMLGTVLGLPVPYIWFIRENS